MPLSTKEFYRFFQLEAPVAQEIIGYALDSRAVQEGMVFFAIRGLRVDGHSFLRKVAEQGALAAVVADDYQGEEPLPLIRVASVEKTLQDLASYYACLCQWRILAITGSLGKTTAKHFLAHMLSHEFQVAVTPRSYNSQLGLPLGVLNMDQGADFAVLEMAMTEKGNIRRLVELFPPHIAAVISVDYVHVENFDGLEGVARAKSEIFTSDLTEWGILADDVPHAKEQVFWGSCPKSFFSMSDPAADYYAEELRDCWVVQERGQKHLLSWNLQGKHFQRNALAAIALARKAGLSWEAIAEAVTTLTVPEGRFDRNEKGGVVWICDAFNACVTSVKAAIDTLPVPSKGGRTYMVFGSMVGMGANSKRFHEEVGRYSCSRVDIMYCIGEFSSSVARGRGSCSTHLFDERQTLKHAVQKELRPGDVILFKGSNIHSLWEIEKEIREGWS